MVSKLVFKTCALVLLFLVLVEGDDHGEIVKEGPKIDRATSRPFPDLWYVFFRPNQIRAGKIMPFYFGGAFATKYPRFLPKEKAEKIPFTTTALPNILEYFGFEQDSKQAKAVDYSLKHCEAKPNPGVVKFCGTSLESMVGNVWKSVGPNTKSIRPLSTSPLPKSTKKLQNYKVIGKAKDVPGSENMLGCHLMTYPYAVYFCHRPVGAVKVLEVKLEGEDGTKIDAIATCHLDTFKWDEDIDAFRFLGTEPGEPVCHVLPPDDLIWVPSDGNTENVEVNTSPGM